MAKDLKGEACSSGLVVPSISEMDVRIGDVSSGESSALNTTTQSNPSQYVQSASQLAEMLVQAACHAKTVTHPVYCISILVIAVRIPFSPCIQVMKVRILGGEDRAVHCGTSQSARERVPGYIHRCISILCFGMQFQNKEGYRHLLIYRDIFGNARLAMHCPRSARYSAIPCPAIGLLPHGHGLKCASKSLNGPVLCPNGSRWAVKEGCTVLHVRMPVRVSRRS